MENEALPFENELTASDAEGELSLPAAEEIGTKEDASTEESVEETVTSAPIDFADLAERDLAAIKDAFPELAALSSLTELAEPARYGELREAGLSPLEAFCASHHKMLLPRRTDNRAHLSASVGRAASAASGRISAATLSDARDLFPSLSDREIEALYRRVSGNR